MDKIKKCFFVITFFFINFFIKGNVNADEKLEFIQKGIEYHTHIIRTASVKYEVIFGKTKNKRIKGNWWIKGSQKALEAEIYEDNKLVDKFKAVFANSYGKSLHQGDAEKKIPPTGAILPNEPPEFSYCYPPLLFLEIFGKNIIEVVKNGTMHLIRQEKLYNQDCFVLSGRVSLEKEYKMWIDINRDFRPLKIELSYHAKDGSFKSTIQNIKLEKIGEIWFPVYGEIVSEDPELVPVIIKIMEVKINMELPEEIFDIQFPPGTAVNDRIIGTSYYIPSK